VRRVSNEFVWAGIASIVCGALIASLLAGTGTPWILVAAVLTLGLLVTTMRRRRGQRVLRAYFEPVRKGKRGQRISHAQEDAPAPRETQASTTDPGSQPTAVRRAGVRSRSLGTRGSADKSDRRP
jgi:hypothetical protein